MAGRFERYEQVAVDDGWDIEEETRVVAHRGRDRAAAVDHRPQPEPGHPVRPLGQPLPGLRARLHLLLRPAEPPYLGLSPGLDFETKLTAKPDAPKVLAAELSRRGYRPGPIAIGTNTDPYQPIEKKLGIMRAVLEALRDFRHPVTVLTKGALIERDADILGDDGPRPAGRRRADA